MNHIVDTDKKSCEESGNCSRYDLNTPCRVNDAYVLLKKALSFTWYPMSKDFEVENLQTMSFSPSHSIPN